MIDHVYCRRCGPCCGGVQNTLYDRLCLVGEVKRINVLLDVEHTQPPRNGDDAGREPGIKNKHYCPATLRAAQ